MILTSEKKERIDKYLMEVLNISRSKIQRMIDSGDIKVNDKEVKSSYTLKENDSICFDERLIHLYSFSCPFLQVIFAFFNVIIPSMHLQSFE